MREFGGGKRSHGKNVVDELLFTQSYGAHDSVEVIAGGPVANGHVPQRILDVAGHTENLPGGQLQRLNQVVLHIPQSHQCPADESAYDIGTSSRAFERSP